MEISEPTAEKAAWERAPGKSTEATAAHAPKDQLPLFGMVLMALLTLAWGVNWPVAKIVLTQVHPLVHRALILSLGGVALLAIARGTGFRLGLHSSEIVPFLGMTFFNVTAYQTFVAFGLYLMPAGRASIIGNSTPIFVALLAPWMLRTRITAMELLGIILGLGGLTLLMGPDVAIVGNSIIGAFMMTAAALSAAVGAIFIKIYRWRTPLAVLTGWSILLGGLPIAAAIPCLHLEFQTHELSVTVWIALVYTIAISTIFGNWCWFRIMTLLPAQKGAMVMFCIPAVGILSSARLLHEAVALTDILSFGLVLAGMVCTFLYRQRR